MKRIGLLSVIICLMILPFASIADESSASNSAMVGEIEVFTFSDSVKVDAFNSSTLNITMSVPSTAEKEYLVSLSCDKVSSHVSLSYDDGPYSMKAGDSTSITITVHADKSADASSNMLTVTISAKVVGTSPVVIEQGTLELPLTVSSAYASDDSYNKIMGVFNNPLPAPFNSAIFSALLTIIIWLSVGIIFSYYVGKAISDKLKITEKNGGTDRVKLFTIMILVIFIVRGISNTLMVLGADESVNATVSDVANIITIAMFAAILWKSFKLFSKFLIIDKDKNDHIDDSILPLIHLLGKIVIAVMAVSSILAIIGLDLGTILTSAGLVSLGISMGAQNTLNQFFCGIMLMAARPFRPGDKIKLGTDGNVMIVRKISIMETEFKDWLNEEVYRIPNSTVMGSVIVNLTAIDPTYKIYEYFDVDYNTDIEKAEKIIMDTVNSHPKVITDGSKDAPSFRFSSMESSSIRLRVTYIITDHELSEIVSAQIREIVFKKFRAEGVSIPFNVIDIHLEE